MATGERINLRLQPPGLDALARDHRSTTDCARRSGLVGRLMTVSVPDPRSLSARPRSADLVEGAFEA
jgi:hypothetical protein